MAKRLMIQYRFWLDVLKPSEHGIAYQLDEMKLNKTRQFHKTIRDGLRLILDLQAGRVDVLFELFPDLKAHWRSQADQDMQERITRLEAALSNATQQSLPPNAPMYAPFTPTITQRPAAERVSVEITDTPKASSDEVATNLISSFSSLFD